jgi:hypothetical protein
LEIGRGAIAAAPTEGDSWAVARLRTQLASRIAMMMAGDPMSTMATVMWPPKSTSLRVRNCCAAMKVTALMEP